MRHAGFGLTYGRYENQDGRLVSSDGDGRYLRVEPNGTLIEAAAAAAAAGTSFLTRAGGSDPTTPTARALNPVVVTEWTYLFCRFVADVLAPRVTAGFRITIRVRGGRSRPWGLLMRRGLLGLSVDHLEIVKHATVDADACFARNPRWEGPRRMVGALGSSNRGRPSACLRGPGWRVAAEELVDALVGETEDGGGISERLIPRRASVVAAALVLLAARSSACRACSRAWRACSRVFMAALGRTGLGMRSIASSSVSNQSAAASCQRRPKTDPLSPVES